MAPAATFASAVLESVVSVALVDFEVSGLGIVVAPGGKLDAVRVVVLAFLVIGAAVDLQAARCH